MAGRSHEAWPHGRPAHTSNPAGQRYDRPATSSGPYWYTSPPSPSIRSVRRTLSAAWRGPTDCNWAGFRGLFGFGLLAGNTCRICSGGRGNDFKSGALIVLAFDGADEFDDYENFSLNRGCGAVIFTFFVSFKLDIFFSQIGFTESISKESFLSIKTKWGGSAWGDGEHNASPSSVSSSYLEEVIGSTGPEPASLDAAGGRIIHGIPIFLLKGGIRVDGSPYEPDGDDTVVTEYDWAPYSASLYASQYGTRDLLEQRVNRTHIVRDVEDSRLVRAGISMRNERVYYRKRSSPDNFFYMYVNVFTQLFVRVPFIEFQMAVLREANIAPAQLHPSSWAAVQAFLAMCLAVGVTPTAPVFFHYFEDRPPPHGGWVSLTSVQDRTLFRPFSDSFKNFKNNYFKVIIDAAGRHEFHDAEGNPLFPFYWTREPRNIRALPVRLLGPTDLEAVRTINALPRRISARYLVEWLCLEDCEQMAFNLMTTPAPRQSNFMAARKRIGASSSSARTRVAPNAPRPPLVRRSSSSGRLSLVLLAQLPPIPQVEVVGGSAPVNRGPDPDPLSGLAAVLMDPSSEAATASVAPLVRKRKDPAGEGRKDKEGSSSRSASKKSRKGKEKVPSAPLSGGIFSPAFNMSDRTKFHMSSTQRALIEPLSEGELTNAMLEMSTRAASLAWYLKEFANRRGADAVHAELLAEQKNSASLQLTMEQLLLTQDNYDKKIEQLEADLEEAKGESADAQDRLAVVRGEHERLLEECSQLKAKVSWQRSSKVELLKTNQALTDDLTKARKRIPELEAGIVFEHEEGFNKALRQASVLAGIQEPFAVGFDIVKDVFYGVLVDLNSMVDEEEPGTEGPSGGAGAAEAVEVEDDEEEGGDN
ncbi:hypothetical protein LR48_Vigan10g123800 [Vigna angularis]|uniref:Transposase (putative) gypsy type domain-containing protein n=1 Tax=Phaseolus angularis TaxID=3914 RepID=A0A0L9VJW7_PHAAN|nr:hypothetical protein LR48_Vigan10g123800 [Vigna angularis]